MRTTSAPAAYRSRQNGSNDESLPCSAPDEKRGSCQYARVHVPAFAARSALSQVSCAEPAETSISPFSETRCHEPRSNE